MLKKALAQVPDAQEATQAALIQQPSAEKIGQASIRAAHAASEPPNNLKTADYVKVPL